MTHRTARAKVGIGQSLGCKALHQCTHHAVRTRIPTSGNHAHGAILLGSLVQSASQVNNETVDVETVHCVDAQLQALQSIFLYRTGGSGKDGHIHIFQFLNVLYYGVSFYLSGASFATRTAHNARNFHILCSFQGFNGGFTNITVSYHCNSNFAHITVLFVSFLRFSVQMYDNLLEYTTTIFRFFTFF